MSLISINIDLEKDNDQYKVTVAYKGQYIGKGETIANLADAIKTGQAIIGKHFKSISNKLNDKIKGST